MHKGFSEGHNPCNRKAVSELVDTWVASDGTFLGFKRWFTDAKPRATLLALHGLNCREEDFAPLGKKLNAKHIQLAAWNLRGQGLDPVLRRRGAWLDVNGMVADLEIFTEHIANHEEPLFLCGDSMGALLALQAAVREPWNKRLAGLLLISPVVGLAQKNPIWVKPLLKAISQVAPGLRLQPSWFVHGKKTSPQLTRISERQIAVENASYRIGPTTIGFLANMGDLIEAALPAADGLHVPVAVFSAGHDVFVTREQTNTFFTRISSSDKTHFHYPESYHQIMFDLDAEQVLADMSAWIETRIPNRNELLI